MHAPFLANLANGNSFNSLQLGLGRLPSGLPPGNFATGPNCRSWRCHIMQITWLIPVLQRTQSLGMNFSQ